MNRSSIEREGVKWVKEGIISQGQLEQLVERYPKKDKNSLLLIFAGLFIGLGFLTFIASNWSGIPNLGRMAIILFSMLGFYIAGDKFYQNKSKNLGISFYLIAILIFGAGIFLTGQMYHYTSTTAFPFFVWALAAILIYAARQESLLLVLGFIIMTIGQIYGSLEMHDYSWLLLLLLLVGFGHYTYHKANTLFSSLFAISYAIQIFTLVIFKHDNYLWLLIYMLVLYLGADLAPKEHVKRAFRLIALAIVFVVTIVNVFFLDKAFLLNDLELSWIFPTLLVGLLVVNVVLKKINRQMDHSIDLVLFIPVVYLGQAAGFVSLILLFVFSLGWLLIGYKQWNEEKVNLGTVAFLISTIVAYVQLAWDFLDKSFFFFIGGIFLFALSYFLEKRRRYVSRSKGREQE